MRGQVVVITGASRGIGAAVARKLAGRGATLALVGLEPDELKQVAADCGPEAGWWEADVTDTESLRAAVEAIVARYGRIDVVMANAGIAAPGFSRSMDPNAWERVIEVDLLGVWRTVHTTLPYLLESKGYLLLVSSLAAIVHIPGLASYNVAKAGVEAMGDTLRPELKHLGVRVGVAHMTFVDTDMVRGADEHPVFGRVRTGIPLASKTYPLEFAVDRFVDGITKRSRTVHVPGWIGALKVFRWVIPHVIELGSRFSVPKADAAALADIQARGAEASSRPTGAGGQADSAKTGSAKTDSAKAGR
ncbi:SDR family oxidoreductase [Kribbella solani]|uniref:SDR family oxidoreductase n=1 Tax=Kribbella solani TaxID=236067 RepID=UPI0029A9257F|nr:SDR family oxidoreductase [Kribbella solani]MDX2971574.1 SDR family oxidoreductase [Kribbella solani]